MEKRLRESIARRRSYYELSPSSPLDDMQLAETIRFAAKHTPSAFNSQSSRLVLLLHDHHATFWDMVKRTLRGLVPEESYAKAETKIDRGFASGYGTVLFFEDQQVVRALQRKYPDYAGSFPIWSEQTSAMHQFVVWTLLEEAGLGASLQHYNPLVDKEVMRQWNLPETWRLIAQMPFGMPAATPPEKTFGPLVERVLVFGE